MAKKSALGRGLGALLPVEKEEGKNVVESGLKDRAVATEEKGAISGIDISLISPNPYQPRVDFDQDELNELIASIKQLGVIQPITVRERKDGYEIISGERRYRASKEAGLKSIPAYIRKASTQEMIEMAVVENIQRSNLNPIEIALGYQRLIDECHLTQEQVAHRVGKNRTTVTNTLRLLSLTDEVKAALIAKKISAGHARVLVTLDPSKQQELLSKITKRQLSVRDTEAMAKILGEVKTSKTLPTPPRSELADRDQLELNEMTNRLRSSLSTQIRINHKKSGQGVIEIDYFDVEELDRIIETILKGA